MTSIRRRLSRATAMVDDEVAAALRRRWEELPDAVRTDARLIGGEVSLLVPDDRR